MPPAMTGADTDHALVGAVGARFVPLMTWTAIDPESALPEPLLAVMTSPEEPPTATAAVENVSTPALEHVIQLGPAFLVNVVAAGALAAMDCALV